MNMNLVILCGVKFRSDQIRSEQRTKTQSQWKKQRGEGEKTRDMKKATEGGRGGGRTTETV